MILTVGLEQVYDNEQSLRNSLTKSTPELLPEMPINYGKNGFSRNDLESTMTLVDKSTLPII